MPTDDDEDVAPYRTVFPFLTDDEATELNESLTRLAIRIAVDAGHLPHGYCQDTSPEHLEDDLQAGLGVYQRVEPQITRDMAYMVQRFRALYDRVSGQYDLPGMQSLDTDEQWLAMHSVGFVSGWLAGYATTCAYIEQHKPQEPEGTTDEH